MGSVEQASHLGSALLTVLCSQCSAHSTLLTPDANISISNSSCGEGDSCESISNEMEEVQVNGSFRSVIKVNGDTEERYLFPPHLLEKLQEEDADKIPAIPSVEPGLLLRPLLLSDFNSGFLPLLAQLTSVGSPGSSGRTGGISSEPPPATSSSWSRTSPRRRLSVPPLSLSRGSSSTSAGRLVEWRMLWCPISPGR